MSWLLDKGHANTIKVQSYCCKSITNEFFFSGWATGSPPNLEDLELATAAANGTPVFIGSGANWENISTLMQAADGVIVSSSLKRHGRRDQPIDPIRVSQFVEAAQRIASAKAQAALPSSVKLRSWIYDCLLDLTRSIAAHNLSQWN